MAGSGAVHPAVQTPPLWRQPDFAKLWLGQSVSGLGSQVTAVALPLTAVLALGASPAQMGVLRAAQSTPYMLLSLFAGVWADRLRRRPILLATNLALAATVGSIPLAAALGLLRLEQLYVVGFLLGALSICFQLAYPAFRASLVGRGRLVEANSAGQATGAAVSVVGPGLGGWFVQALGAPLAMLADAVSYLVAFVSVGLIRAPEPAPAVAHRRRLWQEIGEGLRFVLADPVLRALSLTALAWNVFGIVGDVIELPYMANELALAPAVIGALGVAQSLGALVGSLLASGLTRRYGAGPVLLAAQGIFVVTAAGWLLIPQAAGAFPAAVVAVPFFGAARAAGGLAFAIVLANGAALGQALVPNAMQGRVGGCLTFIAVSTVPFGALAGGVLAERIGLRAGIAVVVVGLAVTTLMRVCSPVRHVRQLAMPEE
jgi:MFS family permease